MNQPTRYLDLQDLIQLTVDLGAGPVRDAGLLDSATARPRSSVFGQDAYSSLDLKAAALFQSICSNHALVDGNKRLAWLATLVFLDINGAAVEITHDEGFDLVMAVAEGRLDLEGIAVCLRTGTVE